ncbi:carbohydrate sulfotransferase 1-like [Glandiceps talaboti]
MVCRMSTIPFIFFLLSLVVALLIVMITPQLKSAATPMLERLRGADPNYAQRRRLINYPARPLSSYWHGASRFKNDMLQFGVRNEKVDWVDDDLKEMNWTQFNVTRMNSSERNVKIIIIAKMRTGSSFVGEFLNQHPDFFYLFEPFLVINQMVQNNVIQKRSFPAEILKLLGKLLNCDTSDYFVGYLNREKWMGVQQSNSLPNEFTKEAFRNECSRKPYFAIKSIRIESIRDLWPFIRNSSQNVKIIHLVRDPRGMVHSRIKLKYMNAKRIYGMGGIMLDPELVRITKDVCRWMVANAQEGSNGPQWLKGKYKLIRYEDVAEYPYKMAKEIYDFIGVPGHPKITEWVEKNTRGEPVVRDQMKYPYQTKRNSRMTSQAWRYRLTPNAIKRIESACGKRTFSMFGYKTLQEPKSLGNGSFSFVEDNIPFILDYNMMMDTEKIDQL